MTFGERILQLRKQLKYSQDDLEKLVGTSAPIVGRYERDEIKPSIEVASKLADALGVSMDYLLGKSDSMMLDKKNLQRLEDIENLPENDKQNIFYTIDNLIKAAKLKNIAAL
ncbi:helix-turn-helix domain-containing protein [Marinilongibacter aquaticus]|uniref:helix-turn-helix domain-containing protein n=1 Tax=Marinilongibacter aquaticus TaxID=2975157 RepID=UPI0021BDBB97|nr:helix-turn-helix transcriptional regulator [Marinilongibacter aquaticus]UBM57588.1 helix-turn-helix domain-containing protein [Marinilongibacter aquaticus]